jgi:hypothetical protein
MLSLFFKTTTVAAIIAFSATGAFAENRMKVVTTFTAPMAAMSRSAW